MSRPTKRVVAWVRIPRLPIELYNDVFLERIGMTTGTFLKVDKLTSIHSRGKFARICVELDLDKPLTPFIILRGHKIPIEYEGLHSICFKCGKYGHKREQCVEPGEVDRGVAGKGVDQQSAQPPRVEARVTSIIPSPGNPVQASVNAGIMHEESRSKEESSYGPWMLAKNSGRKKGNKKGMQQQIDNVEIKKKSVGDPKSNHGINEENHGGTRFAPLINTSQNPEVGPTLKDKDNFTTSTDGGN